MSLGLQASEIWQGYGDNEVLRGCSLDLKESGIYVLTGPNGCGKSTFLRICALLEIPARGKIVYLDGGRSLQHDISLKRRITLVLPRVGLFNESVFGNVAYGMRIRGLRGGEASGRVESALEFVGLSHKKVQNALTLSSGESQRLGIARALVLEPEILFLDEPTASVDEKNTVIIEEIIQKLRQDEKCTVVMTTHDRSQAARLAGRLFELKDGRIT
ncbi:MAG: ATP-binding cassette domain-containing protein [Nitrospirae bacterium]|nr:ATP-binding cassette domain-containing protein [Nitrospirota bacterium]